MKTLFLFLSALCAVVSGQAFAQGQGHVPVIKDGVPVDTPEVQAAKAAHFDAYEKAKKLAARRPSDGKYHGHKLQQYDQHQHQQQYQHQQAYQQHQQIYQPEHHYQNNVIYDDPRNFAFAAYSSEVPVDAPEVQQAKAAHLAALSQQYRAKRSLFAFFHHVPEESPEVQPALLAHASVHEEEPYHSYHHHHYQGPYHIPIITKKGVPVDTPEVQAARKQHLLAHQLAKAGVRYAGGYSQHIPVIAPDGAPYDTPEVYIARAKHLAAHAEESTKHYHHLPWGVEEYGYGYGY